MKSAESGLGGNWVSAYGRRARTNGRKPDPFLLLYVKHRLNTHTHTQTHTVFQTIALYSSHEYIYRETILKLSRAFAFQKNLR